MLFQIVDGIDGFDKDKFDAVIQKIKSETEVTIEGPDKLDTFTFTGTIGEVNRVTEIFLELGLE